MNELKHFDYQGEDIRTITDDDETVWFAGVDIGRILGYSDPQQAIEKLDEDERKLDSVRHGSGQKRKTWTVNESGLYSLILTSTKPEAKAFKRWVTHEVLPAIRKAGRYTSKEVAEKDQGLRKLHHEITELEIRRSELNNDLKEKRQQFLDLLYTDPDQLKIGFK
jgi:anti-repressor protein